MPFILIQQNDDEKGQFYLGFSKPWIYFYRKI